jgi:hypothetical protein
LTKIANVDKKSKAELVVVNKETADAEKELVDLLNDMKEVGIVAIDNIWNEYCRIEAEYFSRMNDAYLEPSTPRESSKTPKKIAAMNKPSSPVIVEGDEDDTALAS